jgi:hypothetical protein
MADYYPLIAKAVGGLDKNNGEIRRALYDRARVALVAQLRGVDPPLNESDITRERLALEEAIRKVETEASRRKPEPEDAGRPSLSDEALRGFRAVIAEAESLGGAAAAASRTAHEVYESVPTEQLEEPAEDDVPEVHPETQPAEPDTVEEIGEEVAPQPPDDGETYQPYEPRERPFGESRAAEPPAGADRRPTHPPLFGEPNAAEEPDYPPQVRSYGRIIQLVVLLLVVAAIAGVGYWQRNTITTLIASLRSGSSTTATTASQANQPAGRPKITDRVGGGNASGTANAPAASVAQKVVLYDEDPGDPNGKRYVGSALWRTETVSPGPGLAPEIAIRADVEIPERHIRMTWSLRRNTDKALPASHTIEIMFTLPADFPEGGISNVPGVLMKPDEQARGVPLAGLAVKVTNGYFLIGLSSVDADVQRNVEALKTRDWFDVPIVYTSGKRAILAIEKGVAGQRAFDEAFRAWGQ